jgi:hypothetical protein
MLKPWPRKEFTLGDVIIANRMFNFSVTAAHPGGTVEYGPRSAPAHRIAEIVASNLAADAAKYGDWHSDASIGMSRPPVKLTSKNIKGSPDWQRKIREALGHYFGRAGRDRQPIVLNGPIGSSSTLMKGPALFSRGSTSRARSKPSTWKSLGCMRRRVQKAATCR